jgi:hypothetical protein
MFLSLMKMLLLLFLMLLSLIKMFLLLFVMFHSMIEILLLLIRMFHPLIKLFLSLFRMFLSLMKMFPSLLKMPLSLRQTPLLDQRQPETDPGRPLTHLRMDHIMENDLLYHNAAVSVNAELSILYWQIGERIRKDILPTLSAKLMPQLKVYLDYEDSGGVGWGWGGSAF